MTQIVAGQMKAMGEVIPGCNVLCCTSNFSVGALNGRPLISAQKLACFLDGNGGLHCA